MMCSLTFECKTADDAAAVAAVDTVADATDFVDADANLAGRGEVMSTQSMNAKP